MARQKSSFNMLPDEFGEKNKVVSETPAVEEITVEVSKPISNPVPNISTPDVQEVAKSSSEYSRKGYYALTEGNYWYLKDITYSKNIQIQDYMNRLIEADREANKEMLQYLPHRNFYL